MKFYICEYCGNTKKRIFKKYPTKCNCQKSGKVFMHPHTKAQFKQTKKNKKNKRK